MPKPRGPAARDSYHHGRLPSALLGAALRRIAQRGVEAFSLREVARDAGVDPSAVYRHFADKGALLAAVARVGFAAMAAQMERELGKHRDPRERLRAAGRVYVGFAARNPDRFRVMFGRHGAGNAAGVSVRGKGPLGRDPHAILVAMLTELDAAERLRVALAEASLAAWCGVHGLASLVVEGAWRPSRDRKLADVVATLVDAFAAPAGTERPASRSAKRTGRATAANGRRPRTGLPRRARR